MSAIFVYIYIFFLHRNNNEQKQTRLCIYIGILTYEFIAAEKMSRLYFVKFNSFLTHAHNVSIYLLNNTKGNIF